ncbi:MAG: hypothetical protein JWN17_2249, partial [Frankiales bacterium]|nr:hypothetical protein [Frankiales bacterium]
LAAARAVRLSGASTGVGASGATMAVTAAVQATCVTGLVDEVTAATLMHAWQAGRAA